jgi:AT hook motif
MDLEAILKQLRDEREQIEVSILAIERLQSGRSRGRGRPPKWMTEVKAAAPKKRGRPKGSGKKAAKGE